MTVSHQFYGLLLAGVGALVLMTAWLPMLLRKAPLSLPILCVGAGAALFALPRSGLSRSTRFSSQSW